MLLYLRALRLKVRRKKPSWSCFLSDWPAQTPISVRRSHEGNGGLELIPRLDEGHAPMTLRICPCTVILDEEAVTG
jgi:hypothetical protein